MTVLSSMDMQALLHNVWSLMNRMNRNRHHLMPMYNFDVGEEDARWEADLLEDDREQQMALNVRLCWYIRIANFGVKEKLFA